MGATLDMAQPDGTALTLRIRSAERDSHPEAPDVWLFASMWRGLTAVL